MAPHHRLIVFARTGCPPLERLAHSARTNRAVSIGKPLNDISVSWAAP